MTGRQIGGARHGGEGQREHGADGGDVTAQV
jgi:hypothetical protein